MVDNWGIRAYGGIKLENRGCACLAQGLAGSTSGCCKDVDAVVGSLTSGLFGGHLDVTAQPGKTLENAFASGCATRLDLPDVVLCDNVEVESVRNVLWSHACVERKCQYAILIGVTMLCASYIRRHLACWQRPTGGRPSFHGLE